MEFYEGKLEYIAGPQLEFGVTEPGLILLSDVVATISTLNST
jgi:hypothetical protein